MSDELSPGDAEHRNTRRVADLMIRTFGASAPLYALRSADILVERGDFKSAAQWRHVSRATEELLAVDS